MLQRLSEWKSVFVGLTAVLLVALILSRVLKPDRQTDGSPSVTIEATEAADHVGENAEVCGSVTNTSYQERIGGSPTFINVGGSYPDQPFTAVIWGDDRHLWPDAPDRMYRNTDICVRGIIRMHEGTPQIEVGRPQQISVYR